MARAGILYSDVVRAATELLVAGKTVTVDNVRKAMGDTGSKSTIAPYLKQWKESQEGEARLQQASLPEGLLNQVKALYATLKEDAALAVRAQETEFAEKEASFASQRSDWQAEQQQLQATIKQLHAELAEWRQSARDAEKQGAQLSKSLQQLDAEHQALSQRFTDKEQQVSELKQQNAQQLRQFEHLQQAALTQRQEERASFEARSSQFDVQLQQARQQQQALQEQFARQSSEQSSLMQLYEALLNIHQQLKTSVEQSKLDLQELQFTIRLRDQELAASIEKTAISEEKRQQLHDELQILRHMHAQQEKQCLKLELEQQEIRELHESERRQYEASLLKLTQDMQRQMSVAAARLAGTAQSK
ncbi:DNA-binding protein [Undibacterium rugosum]|uniref:DNA-binding protein n=1 Tax=Undibacterium rugosum TaxID=2762291 RepID=UPI001B836930|nr:DNA-binding protein [Undibacterium rugosum]MBR7779390.1 DNA-binding protein [Undibacterium rugosum]